MSESSSKRKAGRDSPPSSAEERETASIRFENVPSISGKNVSEVFERVEKPVVKIIKETRLKLYREILKLCPPK